MDLVLKTLLIYIRELALTLMLIWIEFGLTVLGDKMVISFTMLGKLEARLFNVAFDSLNCVFCSKSKILGIFLRVRTKKKKVMWDLLYLYSSF